MLKKFLAALLFAVALPAAAQNLPPSVLELPTSIPTDTPGKVEVVEFFWYGCPHCFALEPTLNAWVKDLPKDVEFKRVPAFWNEQWAIAGRVYYALEATGDLNRLHKALFDAIHKDGLKITNQAALNEWLQKNNVDVRKFTDAEKSFAVESKLKRAKQLVDQTRIDGVPALMVNGKYIIPAGQNMLNDASKVIAMERAELGKTAGKK